MLRFVGILALLMAGCLAEQGLGSSTTRCPDSHPVADGIRLVVEAPEHLVGHCVAVSHADQGVDKPFALRKLGPDGVVELPIEGAGSYFLSVQVESPGDKYCADSVGKRVEHPGAGVVEVLVGGNRPRVCA